MFDHPYRVITEAPAVCRTRALILVLVLRGRRCCPRPLPISVTVMWSPRADARCEPALPLRNPGAVWPLWSPRIRRAPSREAGDAGMHRLDHSLAATCWNPFCPANPRADRDESWIRPD